MPKSKKHNSPKLKNAYARGSTYNRQYSKQLRNSRYCSSCSEHSSVTNAKKIERGLIVASVFAAIVGLVTALIDVLRAMLLFSTI